MRAIPILVTIWLAVFGLANRLVFPLILSFLMLWYLLATKRDKKSPRSNTPQRSGSPWVVPLRKR